MDAQIFELFRLLQNMIRYGSVAAVKKGFVRIKTLGNDDDKSESPNLSNWLRWVSLRAGDTVTWQQPSIGEQVIVFSPSGDTAAGVALGGIYSDEFPAPSNSPSLDTTHYADGAVIEYDHQTHALDATLPDGSSATLTANNVVVNADKVTANADEVICNAPNTTCTGDLKVGGNFTVTGSSALNGGVNAKAGAGGGDAMVVEGTLKATVDVIADDISLANHPHGGVKRGDELSDGPQ